MTLRVDKESRTEKPNINVSAKRVWRSRGEAETGILIGAAFGIVIGREYRTSKDEDLST